MRTAYAYHKGMNATRLFRLIGCLAIALLGYSAGLVAGAWATRKYYEPRMQAMMAATAFMAGQKAGPQATPVPTPNPKVISL